MPLTPKNRKEEWLQGLVDHETTLTPKNRPEEWMKEIIDASGGGGGGGGGALVVHVVESVADKTWQEMKTASASQIVLMVNDTSIAYMSEIQEPMPPIVEKYQVSFVYISDNGDGTGNVAVDTLTCDTANDYPSYL